VVERRLGGSSWPKQLEGAWNAFEPVRSGRVKVEPTASRQVHQGASQQHVPRFGLLHHAGRSIDGKTCDVVATLYYFANVKTGAHCQADFVKLGNKALRTAHRARWTIE